jgi:CheY-like chemotaxis protein
VLVALTGYGQAQDRALSQAAGFDFHFVKPIDMAELSRILSRIT